MAKKGAERINRAELYAMGFSRADLDVIMRANQLYDKYNDRYTEAAKKSGKNTSGLVHLTPDTVKGLAMRYGVQKTRGIIRSTAHQIKMDVRSFENTGKTEAKAADVMKEGETQAAGYVTTSQPMSAAEMLKEVENLPHDRKGALIIKGFLDGVLPRISDDKPGTWGEYDFDELVAELETIAESESGEDVVSDEMDAIAEDME